MAKPWDRLWPFSLWQAVLVLAGSGSSAEGITRYVALPCNESLYLSPVQLVRLNSTCASAFTLLDALFVTPLCCANEVIAPLHRRPSIYIQPWHPGSSLGQRDHQSVLSASCEMNCSLMFLSATILPALQSWHSGQRGLIPISFSAG